MNWKQGPFDEHFDSELISFTSFVIAFCVHWLCVRVLLLVCY